MTIAQIEELLFLDNANPGVTKVPGFAAMALLNYEIGKLGREYVLAYQLV